MRDSLSPGVGSRVARQRRCREQFGQSPWILAFRPTSKSSKCLSLNELCSPSEKKAETMPPASFSTRTSGGVYCNASGACKGILIPNRRSNPSLDGCYKGSACWVSGLEVQLDRSPAADECLSGAEVCDLPDGRGAVYNSISPPGDGGEDRRETSEWPRLCTKSHPRMINDRPASQRRSG